MRHPLGPSIALAALFFASSPARAEGAWDGRGIVNPGVVATASSFDGGSRTGNGLGLELAYMHFAGHLAGKPTGGRGVNGIYAGAMEALFGRVTAYGYGIFAQALVDVTGDNERASGRFALGAQAGGILGLELGAAYRTPTPTHAATASMHVGPYLSLGVITLVARFSPFPFRVGSSGSGPVAREDVGFALKIAPLALFGLAGDWKNAFNPDWSR